VSNAIIAELPEPAATAIEDEVKRETLRTVLRESLHRYRCELMDVDAREVLWTRIVNMRARLGLA
jgi:hypothetical protein